MADATTIADLRRLINEPDDVEPWTDIVLSTRLDAWTGDINSLAAVIWREKAASYSDLVDIQEGNSNRKLSQLYAQALKMADGLDGGTSVAVTTRRASRTRPIERM
jgi:hypothetical protein